MSQPTSGVVQNGTQEIVDAKEFHLLCDLLVYLYQTEHNTGDDSWVTNTISPYVQKQTLTDLRKLVVAKYNGTSLSSLFPTPNSTNESQTQSAKTNGTFVTAVPSDSQFTRRNVVSMPPRAQMGAKSFAVRLQTPTGVKLLRCSAGATTIEIWEKTTSQHKDLAKYNLEEWVIATEDGVNMKNDEIVSEHSYFKQARSDVPLLILKQRTQPKAISKPEARKTVVFAGLSVSANASPVIHNLQKQVSAVLDLSSQSRLDRARSVRTLREFDVQFLLPGGQTRVLTCDVEAPISKIKSDLKEKAGRLLAKPLDSYVIKTPSVDGYLNDESVVLGTISFIQNCRKQSIIPKLNVVEKSAALTKKEKFINVEIGSLLGTPISWLQEDNEISQFRNSMMWVRYQIKKEKDKLSTSNGPSSLTPLGSSSSSSLASSYTELPKADKLLIKLRLPLTESTLEKTVQANGKMTASEFTALMFQKHYEKKVQNKKASDFILKVSGLAEYIAGDKTLIEFPQIRDCLLQNKEIKLSLVENEANEEEEVYIEDFPSEEFMEDPNVHYDHEEICSENKPSYDQMNVISIWEIQRPFQLKIVGVENVRFPESLDSDDYQLYVTAGLFHGGELIAPLVTTQQVDARNANPRWYEKLTTNIQMCHLPRNTRVCFSLVARSANNEVPLGWVGSQLFDYKHELKTGLMSLNLWPDKANPIGTTVSNHNADYGTLYIEFDSYHLPVVFPTEAQKFDEESKVRPTTSRINTKLVKIIGTEGPATTTERLIGTDPLYPISLDERKLIWDERNTLKNNPKALPKLLHSLEYNDRYQVAVMHKMISTMPPLPPVDALELLDSKFADSKVREYGVRCLEQFTDEEIMDYLLQLIQVLKYELYHDSSLSRFLLRRALLNRKIGHMFFWHLKAEIHVQEIKERYGLLLEAYLRGCGSHRAELKKQTSHLRELVRIANLIKTKKDEAVLHAELAKLQIPKLQLPLNPSLEVNGIKIEKCRFMDSKKLPLWLVFTNVDPNAPTKTVIFKSGDDLRQDMLTLQMIRLMDKLWKQEGLNLELSPYGCISTGNDEGMIEVVMNADTMANITKKEGGAMAAFKEEPLAKWLRSNNPTDDQYNKAVDLFVLSLAGYCVATYVLGIGDRHNDNIMCTREGRMFHIDFGHFLGNYKKKLGIKRERAPFVLTPDFAYVMGGKDSEKFLKFVDICCNAYNILRKHANMFINLFAMMLSTGIPELTSIEDIGYLRDAFSLDASDEKAKEKFKMLIYESLATKTTQFNNMVHIWAH